MHKDFMQKIDQDWYSHLVGPRNLPRDGAFFLGLLVGHNESWIDGKSLYQSHFNPFCPTQNKDLWELYETGWEWAQVEKQIDNNNMEIS